MTNVKEQAAQLRAQAEYEAQLPEADRAEFRKIMETIAANSDQAPAPAAPETVPIPGMSGPNSSGPLRVTPNMVASVPEGEAKWRDIQEMQQTDPWRYDLRVDVFPGVAETEVRAVQAAYEEYDSYVTDNANVLAEEWATIATNSDAKLIEKALEDGKTPPKADSFEKAAKARPVVLATARRMRRELQRLDDIAYRAVRAAAPDAARVYKGKANDAVKEAHEALNALTAAVGRFNSLNRVATELAIKSRDVLPTERENMRRRTDIDVGYPIAEITERLRAADGRTRVDGVK